MVFPFIIALNRTLLGYVNDLTALIKVADWIVYKVYVWLAGFVILATSGLVLMFKSLK